MPALPKVLIASSVIERLQKLEDGAVGSLCGQVCENNFYILGMQVKTQEANVCLDLLNLQVCGAFSIGSSVEEVQSYFEDIAKDGEMYENALLLTCTKSELKTYLLVKGIVTKVTHSMVTNAQLASSFLYFRTKSDLTLNIELSEEGIEKAFEDIRKKVPAEDVAFFLTTKHLLIKGRENISGMPGITCDHRLKDLFESLQERGNKDYEVLPANLHFKQTQGSEQGSVQSFAPLLRHVRCSFENAKFLIKIDVLSVVHRNNKIGTLYDILTNSLIRSLTEIERSLLHQFSTGNKKELSTPEPYHFLPLQSSHFITVVYPKNSTDAELKKHREILHLSSGFGLDQPIFRRSQAYNFPGDGSSKGPLLNPHEGLNSGVKGGQVSLVKGLYSYHHYMQEHFDDNGWGCAYRSLQTIVSWFRLQGYTEVKVPTHKQIQECLVKIGDKQSSFIGSRQWIGSTEVSFVLETMLGVTCRILTASTGEEVGSLGSELSYHFQTHGTPIMIGGGVLAHTIIGVDYNRSTGDIKFLILDPHYTGGEDIGVITGKGWVGWKDTKFWTKNAFYNLCLPLRPIGDV